MLKIRFLNWFGNKKGIPLKTTLHTLSGCSQNMIDKCLSSRYTHERAYDSTVANVCLALRHLDNRSLVSIASMA